MCCLSGSALRLLAILAEEEGDDLGAGAGGGGGDIYSCAYCYAELVDRMERLFLHGNEDYWRKWEMAGDMRYLSSTIVNFFDTLEYAAGQPLSERSRGYIEDMRKNALGMIEYYLGLDEAALAEFRAMSENWKSVYLEEAIFGA